MNYEVGRKKEEEQRKTLFLPYLTNKTSLVTKASPFLKPYNLSNIIPQLR
jgi:hypothetical protein